MATKQPGVWGVDLGQCALKAVRLELIDGKVTATAFDYIEHPKILSQPDADPDELTREALNKFLERNDLKGDTVAISVPGQSGLARFVKLPPVEEKKIDDIVRFEAKQQIPFPLEDVVWDYQKLGKSTVSDGYALETEIGLFAMKRDMVNLALQQFIDVNVEVHLVQMAPLSLVNFVTYDLLNKNVDAEGNAEEGEEDASDKECVVALDIGADTSNLVITDGDRVIWQRPIPIGGNRFTRDLTREMKLTFAKAEHVKRNASKSADLRKILLALRPGLNEFVNEVQRSLGYFTNTHRNTKISYMVGLGNAFRLPGLQKFLQEKLQLDVRKLSQMKRLEGDDVTGQPQFKENILSFAVAYGLALQGLNKTRLQTNLLPEEIRVERLVRAKKPWAVATAAALLLAIAGYAFSQGVQYSVYSQENNTALKTAMAEADKAKKNADGIIQEYGEYERKIEESKQTVNRIASGVKERFNWTLIYKYINDCLPQPDPRNPRVAFTTHDNYSARRNYVTENARLAYASWISKLKNPARATKKKAEEEREGDLFIKKNMVQLNVEGINCLYAEDLSKFFENMGKINDLKRSGLSPKEQKNVSEKQNLPQKGWVFEIRGYTYWQPNSNNDPHQFIVRTLVENLRTPGIAGVSIPLSKEMEERVVKKMSYVLLYKTEYVKKPAAGKFEMIGKSQLKEALGMGGGGGKPGEGGGFAPSAGGGAGAPPGGGAPMASGGTGVSDPSGQGGTAGKSDSRSGWSPIGEVAAAVLGGGGAGGFGGGAMPPGEGSGGAAVPPGGPAGGGPDESGAAPAGPTNLPPRTEFIILFVWQEPMTLGEGETPPAPGGV